MKLAIKKEKLVMAITIGIACFTLMLVMFMQFKVVEQTDITSIENMRESELRIELSSWKEKYDELSVRYDEVIAKISEYKNERESDQKTAELLETELKQLNKALGKTDVEGAGVQIVLTDMGGTQLTDDVSVKKITQEDLLLIVNALFGAGAEAVSVNNQRIIAMSDITTIGGTFIQVNSEKIESSYIIKAIGNQDYLESALLIKGGYIDQLKESGHKADVNKVRKLKIEKYAGEISTKYLN